MTILYLDKDGVKTFTNEGELKTISGFTHVMELPPGDWIMRICRDRVILADRSGQNPPYAIDKDGNWEKIEPKPRELTDEEKSEMYYYGNGCHSHIYGDPEANRGSDENEED